MSNIITKKNLKSLAVSVLGTMILMMASLAPALAQTGFINPSDNPSAVSTATGGQGNARQLVLTIVNFFLTFLGLLAVIMIIYGGFLYVSAAGKEDKIETGKKIIMYAVIGIIIILLSFAIVNTVLNAGGGGAGQ